MLARHHHTDLLIQVTVRGYKFNHLDINSTTAVAGKAGITLASAATAVVKSWLSGPICVCLRYRKMKIFFIEMLRESIIATGP